MTWQGHRRDVPRGAYEEARKRALAKARYRCEIRVPGICIGDATTVDHIRPLAEGGAILAESNLRAACAPCNTHLGAQLGGRRLNVRNQRWSRTW